MITVEPVSFSINVIGETTGFEYLGQFRVKPVLTQGEQLVRDAAMRELLGSAAKEASGRAVSQALLISEIRIRSIETPTWWTESRAGLGLLDESPLGVIYDKIQEVETNWKKDVKAKADAAREALRAVPPSK
jgi:hypothetical protein